MLARQIVRSPTTHGAAEVAAHQHGDWFHRPGNLRELPGFGNHGVHREPELLVDTLIRRGLPEPVDAHDHSALAHPAIPRLRRRGFDRDPRDAAWQHGVAIVLGLLREILEAGHRYRAWPPAVSLQPFIGA